MNTKNLYKWCLVGMLLLGLTTCSGVTYANVKLPSEPSTPNVTTVQLQEALFWELIYASIMVGAEMGDDGTLFRSDWTKVAPKLVEPIYEKYRKYFIPEIEKD